MVSVWRTGVSGKGLWSEAPGLWGSGIQPLGEYSDEIQNGAARGEDPHEPAR